MSVGWIECVHVFERPFPLEAAEQALKALAFGRAVERSAEGSSERINQLLVLRARLEAVLLDELAAFDTAGAHADKGSPTTAAWLRAVQRLGRRDASALVHQARELRELPMTLDALRSGAISREHAVQIVKGKTSSGVVDFTPYEPVLVALAQEASPDEVKAAIGHLVEIEAPDRDKKLIDALADRSFNLREVGDLVKVDAMVDKVTAAALAAGVEALSRPSADDQRSWQVRRADAFSEVVMLGLESGQLPQHGRVKPHVNLTMPLDQLTGVDDAGPLLKRFGRIPLATAQRLSCDAVMTRFITDTSGEVLDVGRSGRHTNAALNKAVALMYDRCATGRSSVASRTSRHRLCSFSGRKTKPPRPPCSPSWTASPTCGGRSSTRPVTCRTSRRRRSASWRW